MSKNKLSLPIRMLDDFYSGANITSYQTFNHGLQKFLESMVMCGIKFELPDYTHIVGHYKSHYWLMVSSNGKHKGEFLYRYAVIYDNISFCQSYEYSRGREPFILNNKRLFEGAEFKYKNLYWTVTGWNEDNKKIKCVGYETRSNEGKRKLMEFDREKWLSERKLIQSI